MTSEVMERSSTAIATTGADPYAAYGAKVGTQGTFLTFKNGEYLAGQDAKEVPLATRVAANMAGLRIGWRRWMADQLTDDLTEPLIEQPHVAHRNTLGDLDQSLWERDAKTNVARDPWQLTNVLEFVNSEGENFIYSTGSKGGIGAIGRLCKEYGKLYRQRPGQVPIVELGRDSYMHKEFGKTYFPVFTIVDWADENALTVENAGDVGEAAPPAPVQESKPAAKRTRF